MPLDWLVEHTRLLGVELDEVLASWWGMTPLMVGRIRRFLKHVECPHCGRLVVENDTTNTGPRGKRLNPTDEQVPLLGKMPDKSLAAVAGVSGPTVRRWRIERGIRCYQTPEKVRPELLEALTRAAESDRAIAKRFGLSPQRVCQIRTKHRIPKPAKPAYVPPWRKGKA